MAYQFFIMRFLLSQRVIEFFLISLSTFKHAASFYFTSSKHIMDKLMLLKIYCSIIPSVSLIYMYNYKRKKYKINTSILQSIFLFFFLYFNFNFTLSGTIAVTVVLKVKIRLILYLLFIFRKSSIVS